ncbi:hypothetical protein L228DRAFT_270174 [Xylona heveae TC161]|uniref:Uncharacterized protein n=1 Tax=Xylona heveae (strain CBS 132557 / TC161) TaxID=1328760 RepID=A0A165FFB6_XYLHT|nr:hypothetical protein L228DRAFT_270174 [Xylona heveae TC161]KZF20909.1 hypothetical protein L228DRAFT_270174 [Xylona heveae TC161]
MSSSPLLKSFDDDESISSSSEKIHVEEYLNEPYKNMPRRSQDLVPDLDDPRIYLAALIPPEEDAHPDHMGDFVFTYLICKQGVKEDLARKLANQSYLGALALADGDLTSFDKMFPSHTNVMTAFRGNVQRHIRLYNEVRK